jgi:hypothetical protein
VVGWWSLGGISTILLPSSFASQLTFDIIVLWIHSANASWFGARNALIGMCRCELFGALAHNTRTCHHVVCAQSDLPQNDCKRVCHLHIASVAALRVGTETDAKSPALDSVHGSQRLSALALSAWPQRVASAHVSQHWLTSRGSHDDGTVMTTMTNDNNNNNYYNNKDNDDNDKNNNNDDDNNDDNDDDNNNDDNGGNNDDNNNRAAGGGGAVGQTVSTMH